MERISTGISELDDKLEGGFPEGKGILITGESGSGKTILALHLLYKGCLDNRKCLFIATEETVEDILLQGESLGLDLRQFYDEGKLVIKRVYEERGKETIAGIEWGIGVAGELLSSDIVKLKNFVDETYDIILIDNLGVFTLNMTIDTFRSQFDGLNYLMAKRGYSFIFIMDETSYKRTEGVAAYSVYGLIKMSKKENPFTNKHERYLEVLKLRNTQIPEEPIRFEILPKRGIVFIE